MLTSILDFLVSGVFRRGLAFALAIVVPILNQKFGWNLTDAQILGWYGTAAFYIGQSALKEAHSNTIAAAAADQVKTVDDAVAVLNAAPAVK